MSQLIEEIIDDTPPEVPDIELPDEDGLPLETNWHRVQINLLVDSLKERWRDRQDFFVGGNMFIYYSLQQARNRDYRGPDFFLVKGIESNHSRTKWIVWEEGGRYPDVIVELLSASTANVDLGAKKQLYAQTFHTPNYLCYDPETDKLQGWRLSELGYEPLQADPHGRLWSTGLDAWVGVWEGSYQQITTRWLRLFDAAGLLIPTEGEAERQRAETAEQRAETAEQRAETAEQRAETAEQRAAMLTERLRALGVDPEG